VNTANKKFLIWPSSLEIAATAPRRQVPATARKLSRVPLFAYACPRPENPRHVPPRHARLHEVTTGKTRAQRAKRAARQLARAPKPRRQYIWKSH
jgi:hypothetical protein